MIREVKEERRVKTEREGRGNKPCTRVTDPIISSEITAGDYCKVL